MYIFSGSSPLTYLKFGHDLTRNLPQHVFALTFTLTSRIHSSTVGSLIVFGLPRNLSFRLEAFTITLSFFVFKSSMALTNASFSLLLKKSPRGRAVSAPDLDHGVTGSNPAGDGIIPKPKQRFIAQSLSCSPFYRLEMTEVLLKERKTLTNPSILIAAFSNSLCFS